MGFTKLALLSMIHGTLAACGTMGLVQGATTDSRAHGRVKMGVPF
jgi:hypothetical protein